MFGTVLKLLLLKNLKTTFRQRKLFITEIILLFIFVPGFIALTVLGINANLEKPVDVVPIVNETISTTTATVSEEGFSTASEIFNEQISTIPSTFTFTEETSTTLEEFSTVSEIFNNAVRSTTTSQSLNESLTADQENDNNLLKIRLYMNISFSSKVENSEIYLQIFDESSQLYSIHVIKETETILPNITAEITEMNLVHPSFKYKIILHDQNGEGWHNEPHMIPDFFGFSFSSIPFSYSESKNAFISQMCLDRTFTQFYFIMKTGDAISLPLFYTQKLEEPFDVVKGVIYIMILKIMEQLLPILICIPTLITVHGLCEEKDNNIHTFMVVMGLDRSLFILSHLIFALIKMYLYVLPIGITVFVCFEDIGGYMFLLIFLYSHVLVSIIFLISSLTKKTTVVAFVVFGLNGLTFVLNSVSKWTIFDITTTSIISFFLPSFAFKYGLEHLTKVALYDQDINFIAAPIYMPLCYPVFALLFQSIFFLLLAFYFDAVIPIDDSPKKHPLFFVGMKYDNVSESVKETQLQSLILESSQLLSQRNKEYFESDKIEIQADIDVFHLSKKWSNGRYGVQDITFKAYPKQVTALLGHNGAGKSTTFSILSGFTKSTCGKAYVCGQEPRTLCQSSVVGFCPQWDPLFPHLNVREHLQFYQSLKSENNYEEVEGMIKKLGLNDVVNYRSKFLNAGMKRKLCVGMAMIGNSKVIILDEPTHGMDTLSRKQLIEIIRAAKSDHTILLATHYMDEADAISDRIIILSNGNIICNGSSNFLKEKVGTGFLLTVDFTNTLGPESYQGFAEAVLTIVSKNCKDAKIHGHVHQQFTIFLPNGTQRLFPAIFSDLETQKDALQINTFDIHKSTLEEVFIKVTDEYEPNQQRNSDEIIKDFNEKSAETYTACGLFMFQVFALLIRKWHYARRHYIRFAIPYIAVVVFLAYYFYVQRGGTEEKYWQKDESTAIGDYSDITVLFLIDTTNDYSSIKNMIPKSVDFFIREVNDTNTNALFYTQHPLAFIITLLKDKNAVAIGFRKGFPNGVPIALNTLANSFFDRKDVIKTIISIAGNDEIIKTPIVMHNLYLYFLIIFPLPFMISIFLHVEEIGQGVVHLYQRTQMSLFSYWLASFIFDFTYAIIPILIEVITILVAGNDILLKNQCWYIIIIGILLLALMFLLQSYVFSTFFKSSTLAVIMFLVYNVLIFVISSIVIEIIDEFFKVNVLVYVSMVFPLANLLLLIKSTEKGCGCDDIITFCNGDIESSTCYGEFFLTVFLNIVFNLIGLIIWSFRRSIFSCQSSPSDLTPYKENEDVLKEKRKVESLGPDAFQIYSLNLRKMYSGLVAVRDITMGVAHYECFGLLGANGAGKSTFFNMLTASMKPSCGTGYVGGIDIRKQPLFGFCPQIPRFLRELSVEETVYFFIRLKGYLRTELAEIIIESFYLRNIKDTRVGNLTGGELRRLSIAIALITNSDIIMLDEPTTGVDPRTRRHIWELLIALRTIGSSQLLTSHSMEECEALCTKIGFINHGVFIGIGTSQHLKNRFGNTHRLTIILNGPNEVVAEKLNFEIQAIFKATAISVSGNVPDLIWSIPKTSESLSQLYSRLIQFIDAQSKETNGENPIKDFSIVGTSLEEIFATMVDAKIQYEFRF